MNEFSEKREVEGRAVYCEMQVMVSQKRVLPAKEGIQGLWNLLIFLDSRFHGNDLNPYFYPYASG